MNENDNTQTIQTYLNLYKVFIVSLLFSLFFFETTNLLFYSIVSITVGIGYYLLNEIYPHFIVPIKIIWIIVKHKISRLSLPFAPWTKSNEPRNAESMIKNTVTNSLIAESNKRNILLYYDNKIIGNNHKKYIYLFNEKSRSNDLIIFKDEFNNDITDSIEPYLGPLQNFHGSLLTPADFNRKKIYVFRDGLINVSKTFEEHEPIVFA
jgi:Family of unknown function (DUF5772)